MGNTITIVGAAGKMGKWFFDYFINIKNGGYNLEKRLNIVIDKILLYDIKDINYIYAHQNFNKEVVIVSTNIFSTDRSLSLLLPFLLIQCHTIRGIRNHD